MAARVVRARVWLGAVGAIALAGVMLGSSAAAQEFQPFLFVRNRIVLPAMVNGEGPYAFLLDTAGTHTAVDRTVATHLGLSGETAEVDIAVCGQRAFAGEALTGDLSGFAKQLGLNVAGVLGGRAMTGMLELDFAQRAALWQSAIVIAGEDPNRVRLETGPEGVWVPCAVDGGAPMPAVIDTLFAGTLRLPAGRLGEGVEPAARLVGAGETFARLKSVQVAAAAVRNPLCTVAEEAPSAALGVGYLRHFRVTLGLPDKFVTLAPAAGGKAEEPPVRGTGIVPARATEAGWTVDVVAGSPADEAGVQPGDVLYGVHGIGLAGAAFDRVQELLSAKAGPAVRVDLLRDGTAYALELTPKRLF